MVAMAETGPTNVGDDVTSVWEIVTPLPVRVTSLSERRVPAVHRLLGQNS